MGDIPKDEYRIEPGDNLTKIAQEHGTTIEALVELNGIEDPDLIYAGDTLKLPETEQIQSPAAINNAFVKVVALEKELTETITSDRNQGEIVMGDKQGLSGTDNINHNFLDATEGEQNWAIRYGAEPVDFHGFILRDTWWDKSVMEGFFGIKGGMGSFSNHLYLEVGKVNEDGEFDTLKRIHGFSIVDGDDGERVMAREDGGRAFMMVVDGKHTQFSQDPIYQDDPHETKPNQLQSAGDSFWFGEDANQIVFQGNERDVLQLYGAMIRSTIELNNQDLNYSAFAGEGTPNGNTLHGELREKLEEMSGHMGIEIGNHDPSGWDVGLNDELETSTAQPVATWESIDELRGYINTLEEAAATQLDDVVKNGAESDLDTQIPEPPNNGAPSGNLGS